MTNCAACNDILQDSDYLECARCSEVYHYQCLNISMDEAKRIEQESNLEWKCPICKSKQPKGDNSKDRVRPSTPTGLAEITFNVTRRKAQNKPEGLTMAATGSSDCVTRSDIQLLIREEMRSVMTEFAGQLNSTINSRLQELNDQFSEFKTSVSFLSEQYDNLKANIDTNNSEIKLLKTENALLRSELSVLAGRVRQIDQLSRSSNLELQCVPEKRSENVMTIIKQLGNVVKCPINDHDIAFCSRIAKSNPDTSRPRSILVKFNTPRTRDSLLAAAIQYNKVHSEEKLNTSLLGLDGKKSAVYIVENLTIENKGLHAAARLRAKQLDYKYVWVRGGRVYVRKSDSSEAVFIRNMDTINSLK